jgi:hypothetical protein
MISMMDKRHAGIDPIYRPFKNRGDTRRFDGNKRRTAAFLL